VFVGAFVVGAIFTPPDVVSQFMLALPLWLLYELGIVLAPMVGRSPVASEAPGGGDLDKDLKRTEAGRE